MFSLKSIWVSITIAGVCGAALMACETSVAPEPQSCSVTDTSIKCLLEAAQTSLNETQDPFMKSSAAAELAIAYDTAGEKERAQRLISDAIKQAETISDVKQRGNALVEILTSVSSLSRTDKAEMWIQSIIKMRPGLEPRATAEIGGKTVIVKAVHINAKAALSEALQLPQESDVEGYAKAITLRKLANVLAKQGDLETSRKAIDSITMSIDYYKAMARSDIARAAYQKGDKALAQTLLDEANPIARSLGNGYFVGAALRDIGYSYYQMDMPETAEDYFAEALDATAIADKQNEKARATSRIATRLSDARLLLKTTEILETSAAFAETIESNTMKAYSYYEIAGAAGISGQFKLAEKWLDNVPEIPMGSTSSIHAAAKRDLAWGLARNGRIDEALSVVNSINTPREKIHALSRIVRVLQNPEMEALPRYL